MKFGEEPPHIKLCFYNTTVPEQREVFFEKFIEWLCQYDERLGVEFISDDPERIRHPFSYDKLKTNRQEVFNEITKLSKFYSFYFRRRKQFKYSGDFSIGSFSPTHPIPRSSLAIRFPLTNKNLDSFNWQDFYMGLLNWFYDVELSCLHMNSLEEMKRPKYELTSFGRWDNPNIPFPYWAQSLRKDLYKNIDVSIIKEAGFRVEETLNHITIFVTNDMFDIVNQPDKFHERSSELISLMPKDFYKGYYEI